MKKPIPFGKYLLLERINVGGMAEVFKAKAFGVEGFERLVAVKRILPSIAEDQEFITMFIDEAKIAVQLTHANIGQIFDLGKVGDSYFIAMEFVHGKDLRAIFDRCRKRGETVPVPMACYTIMKVCEGLDYAHNKKDAAGRDLNLVHRDVSPQNVLLSYDGEIKLIDFGIAKAANKAGKTQAGILKGKFGYMSPEQVRGLPIDRRSDCFSVGICLYELLTGERLFVGESDFSTLEKVRNVEIMPPSTYNRRIPEELEQIVLKALAKDVDDRYQTAMDLHDDLQSFMYTSGNFFARKDLSSYMRKSFSEEMAKENQREEEYRRMEAQMSSSGLDAFDDLPSSSQQPKAAAPAPASMSKAPSPPTPPPPNRGPKRTMMGMGAAAPPPPPPRSSGAPARSSGAPPPPPPRSSGAPPQTSGPPAPPAAGPPGASNQPPAPPAAGPALDMDWDDDELATQIYDTPGKGGEPEPAGPSASAGPGGAPSPFGSGPAPSGPAPSMPGPAPSGPAPSMPGPAPEPPAAEPPSKGEPTELTTHREGGRKGLLGAAIAAAAVLLVGLGIGGWILFAPQETGQIHLETEPTEVVVLFDEEAVPATSSPFVIRKVAPEQTHLIEVKREGYKPWSMQVELQPGEKLDLPKVTLAKEGDEDAPDTAEGVTGTGFVLDTEPSGATILVDGEEIDQQTPAEVTDLEPGKHTVRVEHGDKYVPWETEIEVEEDQVLALSKAVLSLQKVDVTFESDPSGAEVRLERGRDTREVGETPVTEAVDITGDPWTVVVTKDGYEEWSEELEVPKGKEELTVEAELEEAEQQVASAAQRRAAQRRAAQRRRSSGGSSGGGSTSGGGSAASGAKATLRINSRPWSQVYVDGQLIGNTPQMNVKVRAGSHRVTLVNPDFNIRKNITVNVGPGETKTMVETLTPGG